MTSTKLLYGAALASTLGKLLYRHYSEPHRHFHTWKHITDMLLIAGEVTYAQAIAVMFHDAVYIPGFQYNEEASVALLKTYWNSHRDRFLEAKVADMNMACIIILDTSDHIPSWEISQLVVDADLSSLGATEVEYNRNKELIRKEYCAFNDEQFQHGRIKFLQNYSSRASLFHTQHFISMYENPAKENMKRELKELTI